MVENVTYVLGAGFSAYAGISTMSDFLSKAKDLSWMTLPQALNPVDSAATT